MPLASFLSDRRQTRTASSRLYLASHKSLGKLRENFDVPRFLRDAGTVQAADSERDAVLAHLLEMGFPTAWCARALAARNDADVSALAAWILAHTDALEAADKLAAEYAVANNDHTIPKLG